MSHARRGFTIIELLVVVFIVALLAVLLLPAMNRSQHTGGRRSVCANNLRQLALSVYQYENIHGRYPGYVMPQGVLTADQGDVATRPVSWVFAILPQIERSDIADSFGANAPTPYAAAHGPYTAPDFILKILICPSDVSSENPDPEGLADQARLSYVVNTGLKDQETNPGAGDPPTMNALPSESRGLPRDWAANGVFHYSFPYEGPDSNGNYTPTGEKITKTASGSLIDGASTTLLLSENADAGRWTNVLEQHVGFDWQATVDDNHAPAPAADGAQEFLTAALLRINDQAGLSDSAADLTAAQAYGRPSSYHPGGVNVAYADAHTSFLNQDIDYQVYCQLMTPAGEEAGPAGIKGQENCPRLLFKDCRDGREAYAMPIDESQL